MKKTALSLNVNKYALVRNSRGQNLPDILWAVNEVLAAGAHGITVHPRMDQRHIRFDDVPIISQHLTNHHPGVEFNVECENHPKLIEMVLDLKPAQCTLVPVDPGEITSSHGWDLPRQSAELAPTVSALKAAGVRVSIFMNPIAELMPLAAEINVDRIEIYTESYAKAWGTPAQQAQTDAIWQTAHAAQEAGLKVNAGHDLDRHNLIGLIGLDVLEEVSIGHAHICRSLEVGTRQSITELLTALGWA